MEEILIHTTLLYSTFTHANAGMNIAFGTTIAYISLPLNAISLFHW